MCFSRSEIEQIIAQSIGMPDICAIRTLFSPNDWNKICLRFLNNTWTVTLHELQIKNGIVKVRRASSSKVVLGGDSRGHLRCRGFHELPGLKTFTQKIELPNHIPRNNLLPQNAQHLLSWWIVNFCKRRLVNDWTTDRPTDFSLLVKKADW